MIGKMIMAHEGRGYFTMGEIVGLDDDIVNVYSKQNPQGYQYYDLKRSDFDKWVNNKLYKLRNKRRNEVQA